MWLLIGCFSLFGANSFAEIDSGEEALFLRRIADFWQEGEYGIAKKQLEEFLIAYPQSPFSSLLHASLGDLLLREKNFSEALAAYSAISSPDLVKRTFLNRMECLYNLEWYATLADECEACLLKQPIDADTQEKTTFYLAIALYQQCLSANKEPQILYNLAKRAEPYFEILLKTDLSSEIAHAFSHLCCILKEYEKAANLYLDLAAKEPAMEEEMTFQAALIQAQYDKSKALETLAGIAKKGQTKGKEAAYNCMVLFFESGRYEELIDSRDSILASIAEEKKAIAHYFLGRSLIHLEKYREAAEELTTFLALDPENDKIAKGRLLLAQVLKKIGQLDAARTELNALIADCSDLTEQATLDFEWADLEYQAGNWKECRLKCHHFLRQFPSSEWTSYAWRLLVSASGKLSCESLESKEQFILDLEALLREQNEFPIEERCDWQFYLGQAYFHLGQFEKALFILEPLLQMNLHFSQKANARLAFGLCERDFKGDLASFCLFGEEALQQHADLMETGLLHAALFNAYLELSKHSPELLEKSAAHLYDAFLVSDCVNSFKYLNSDLPGEQSAERDSNLHQVVETVAKLQLSFLPFPICPDIDKKHIRDLIITLDDGSILSLSAKMSRLAEIGDQIAHLHPMTFIKETLSDPNLRKRMKKIFSHPLKRTGIMTGSGFRKGFNHHLTKAANIGELDTYIESFANSLHVSAKEIKPLIQSHEWTNLYVYLIEKTCAREDL
ncbi:MAG TPA: tetratricopeptide repeat protein [Chlamydiales bacterium]|nr:tetratricopeptide repeat protein [Chlamydiales bacterium]